MKTKTFNFLTVLAFIVIAQNSFAQYCTSAGPTSTIDSDLGAISLTGNTTNINIPASCPGTLGIENLTATQSADLTAGGSYTLNVEFDGCQSTYTNAGEAWIDFDLSGTFDANESIGTYNGVTPSGNQVWNFTVPATACNGTSRLRVMQEESGSNPLDPCGSFTWGAAIDAEIVLIGGSCQITGCTDPTATNYNPNATISDGSCYYGNPQDCGDATVICRDYYEPDVWLGVGDVPGEAAPGSCLGTGEKNSRWYQFTSFDDGVLGFTIFPVTPSDDYDWAVYDITNGGCTGIALGNSPELSCDYSANICPPPGGDGSTGPNGDLSGPCSGQNQPLMPVDSGHTYTIMVSQYTDASQDGYSIIFDTNGTISGSSIEPIQDTSMECGKQALLSPHFIGSIEDTLAYLWTPSELFIDSTASLGNTVKISEDSTMIYVQVTNGDCVHEDSILILTEQGDFMHPEDTSLCFGDTVLLDPRFNPADSLDSILFFAWTPNLQLNDTSLHMPQIVANYTQKYYVHLQNGICFETDSMIVTVAEQLVPNATYELDYTLPGNGFSVVFENTSTGQEHVYWTFEDESFKDDNYPVYEYAERGTYPALIAIENQDSLDVVTCVDTFLFDVEIPMVDIPNIITPNGDGINDFFQTKGLRTQSNLKIYNRWGRLVYESLNYEGDWNGDNLTDGVYIYEIMNQKGAEIEKYNGFIQIMR